MAEQTAQDQIQAIGVTKRMLGLAEAEPLPCAFALTKDKKECVLVIGKSGSGKKTAALLKADGKAFVDLQTLRFGRVAIHLPDDPGTVHFTVNRSEAGGTLVHMNKLVKKSGYQALVINADENLENEAEGPADGTLPAAGSAPATEGTPPPQTAAEKAASELDAFKKRLAALIQQAMATIAADPTKKDTLLVLAKESQRLQGAGDLPSATARLNELDAALNGAPGASAAPANPAKGAVVYAKSRLAWIATSRKVASDVGKLRAVLEDRYGKHANAAQIVKLYDQRVEPILKTFDEELADKLDDATNATDAAAREKLVQDARRKIEEYKAFLQSETLIGDLDENPWVKLSIRTTMGATLNALAASVR